MKKCPFCAEEIQDEAIKCKHCGEMLARPVSLPSPPPVSPPPTVKKSKMVAAMALSLLVFPGSGHFYLKKWVRGLVWGGIFSVLTLSSLATVAPAVSGAFDSLMSTSGEVSFDTQRLGMAAMGGVWTFLSYLLAALDCWWAARQAAAD